MSVVSSQFSVHSSQFSVRAEEVHGANISMSRCWPPARSSQKAAMNGAQLFKAQGDSSGLMIGPPVARRAASALSDRTFPEAGILPSDLAYGQSVAITLRVPPNVITDYY